jgi:secreted trypsin-like serine protease
MSSGKLVLVLAVLLGAVVCSPAAIALKAVHIDGRGRRARDAARPGARPRQSQDTGTRAAAVAHEAIIGGMLAEDGTFGSAAYILGFQGRLVVQCTGTVVAPSLILTAGHCVENMRTGAVNKPAGYRVVTGAVDWMTGGRHVSKVVGVIVYPRFVRRFDDGDAALLVLASPIATPPVALATTPDPGLLSGGTAATMVGWGITSFGQQAQTERLSLASTVVQGDRWCKRNAPPFYAKDELCTIAPPKYATGGCNGDSGGPLLVPGPSAGESVEVGIATHVYGRCSTRRPTVFTRVDSISTWVHTWVEAYKQPTRPPAPPPAAP